MAINNGVATLHQTRNKPNTIRHSIPWTELFAYCTWIYPNSARLKQVFTFDSVFGKRVLMYREIWGGGTDKEDRCKRAPKYSGIFILHILTMALTWIYLQ